MIVMLNRLFKYFALIIPLYLHSAPVIITNSNESFLIDLKHIQYFETETPLSILEIVNNQEKWFKNIQSNEKFLKIQNTKAHYWLKIEFENQSNFSNWIFENADSHIDYFEYYILSSDNQISTPQKAGYSLPFQTRNFKYKNFLFEFNNDSKFTVFIKAKSSLHNAFFLKVSRLPAYLDYSLTEYVALGFFYGILLIMLVYNLISYLITRERLFLLYSLYVCCAALVTLSEDGLGFQYIWGSLPSLNKLIFETSPTIFVLFLTLYSSEFLDLNKNGVFKQKWVLFTSLGLLVLLVFNLLNISIPFDEWLLLIPYLLILFVAIAENRRKNRFAPYFMLAFGFVAFGAFFTTLRMNGIFSGSSVFSVYLFNYCIVAEVLLFAIFQSEKFRILKKEKESADKELIQQLVENEKLKDKVNRELETKVAERTAALEIANLELSHQKEELTVANEMLKEQSEELELANDQLSAQAIEIQRMNQLLNLENQELKTNVTELAKARVMSKEVNFDEFSLIFPNPEVCMQYLAQTKWNNHPFKCRKCGNNKHVATDDPLNRRCTKCRYNESATAYTIFHKCKFHLNKAFYILYLVFASKNKITSQQISELIDLRLSTCWHFSKRIKEAMTNKKLTKNDEWTALILTEEE